MTYEVAVIGTGQNGVAQYHGYTWTKLEETTLVACADIVRDNAELFAAEHDIDPLNVFEDYHTMLSSVEPDIVSVCTPPQSHPSIVADCAKQEFVDAIHCEKPMAQTWGECRQMVRICDTEGVQLTFNHERRFGPPFRDAKALVEEGMIGDLKTVAFSFGDLFIYGTHSIDLCGFFNDDRDVDWVIGQIDYREESILHAAHSENQAFALWQYDNGVHGMASTGAGSELVGAHNRLIGTDGELELLRGEGGVNRLRYRASGDESWSTTAYDNDGPFDNREFNYLPDTFREVLDALEAGRESAVSATKALRTTEVIYAAWESSRRRGRVDLPLDIEDNPLESMVDAGELALTRSN